MALDDRIQCAAPACSLTSFHRLLATSGPQDAEQNLFGQIAEGLDEADFVLMRAPKPTLLCAGTRDATFDITGTWDVYREGKRFFSRLGLPERVDICEADEPHGFTQPLRVGAVRWMRRWLLEIDDAVSEPDLPVRPAHELYCTPSGQVLRLPGERSVFDLNRDRLAALLPKRNSFWKSTPPDEVRNAVRKLTRIRSFGDIAVAERRVTGSVPRMGYRIDKVEYVVAPSISLPVLDFRPQSPNGHLVVYLHSSGKQTDAGPAGKIERLVKAGARVLAVDLPGLGELEVRHPRDWGHNLFGANLQEFFLAYLLGESLVSIRTESLFSLVRSVATEFPTDRPVTVDVIANGTAAGIPALHAVALEPGLFGKLELRRCLDSWDRLLEDVSAGKQLGHTVHAALTLYDLPDLVQSLGPDRIVVEDPVDGRDQLIRASR